MIWIVLSPVTWYNKNVPILKKINKDFFKKWTSEMAYVLGFFAADGCITVSKRGSQFWSIQIKDKELLEEIRKVTGSEHMISIRQGKRNGNDLYRFQVGSIEMCNNLRTLGYSERKTENLALPHVPKKYISDFVRGYFDGDGSVWVGEVHKKRKTKTVVISVAFTSGSQNFLTRLQLVLSGAIFTTGSISKRKGKECWCLRYSVRDSLKLCDFMYNSNVQSNKLLLTRKKQVFEEYRELQS